MAAMRYRGDNRKDIEHILPEVWGLESDENLGESCNSEFSKSGSDTSDGESAGESEKSWQSFEKNQDLPSESSSSAEGVGGSLRPSSCTSATSSSNGSKRKQTAKSKQLGQPPSKRNRNSNTTRTSATRETTGRVSARGRSPDR